MLLISSSSGYRWSLACIVLLDSLHTCIMKVCYKPLVTTFDMPLVRVRVCMRAQ